MAELEGRLDHFLRIMIAYKFEGDMCRELEKRFNEKFRRGQEGSPIDAMLLLDPDDISAGKLAIDMKTAVMVRKAVGRHDESSGLIWVTRYRVSAVQDERCDVYLLGWPMLRTTSYWSVVTRELWQKPVGDHEFIWIQAWNHGSIESIVPPQLWPMTMTIDKVCELLRKLMTRLGDSGRPTLRRSYMMRAIRQEPCRIGSYDSTAENVGLADLYNEREKAYHALMGHLREAFENSRRMFTLGTTRYQPYTADFLLNAADGTSFFVEVKLGSCRGSMTRVGNVKQIIIEHEAAHFNVVHRGSYQPYFLPTSGRWTFLLTEVSMTGQEAGYRFATNNGQVPRYMLLLHRNEIPKHWWYSTPPAKLAAAISPESLIDMSGDIEAQIKKILERTQKVHGHRLPDLEVLSGQTPEHLTMMSFPEEEPQDCVFEAQSEQVDQTFCSGQAESMELLESKRTIHADHQARQSLAFLHACRSNKDGLLFDFETHLKLRSYAFTTWQWQELDAQYVQGRPACSPVAMFELPPTQPFVLLSFGVLRWSRKEHSIFVHPFVSDTLRQDAQEDNALHRQRVLVLTGEDNIGSRHRPRPLYAIPASILYHENLDKNIVNHNRWRPLTISKSHSLQDFRFDRTTSLLARISSSLQGFMKNDGQPFSFQGMAVNLTTRNDIFEEIRPGFQHWPLALPLDHEDSEEQ